MRPSTKSMIFGTVLVVVCTLFWVGLCWLVSDKFLGSGSSSPPKAERAEPQRPTTFGTKTKFGTRSVSVEPFVALTNARYDTSGQGEEVYIKTNVITNLNNIVVATYNAPAKKFLLKETKPENNGFQIVFVHNGRRYTVQHNWICDGIQFFFRPNGTHGPDSRSAVIDVNSDGVVDFGGGGDNDKKTFLNPDPFSSAYNQGQPVKGTEHHPYWQKEYEEMIFALKKVVGVK